MALGNTKFTRLDWILSVAGLIAWGLSLIGVVTNLLLGSTVLLTAFGLIGYEFWRWSQSRRWHLALRIIIVVLMGVVVFWSGGKQVVYQYQQEHSTTILPAASPQSTLAEPSPSAGSRSSNPPASSGGDVKNSERKKAQSQRQSGLHLQRAKRLYAEGKHDEALTECDAALRVDPNNENAIVLRQQIVRTIRILEPR